MCSSAVWAGNLLQLIVVYESFTTADLCALSMSLHRTGLRASPFGWFLGWWQTCTLWMCAPYWPRFAPFGWPLPLASESAGDRGQCCFRTPPSYWVPHCHTLHGMRALVGLSSQPVKFQPTCRASINTRQQGFWRVDRQIDGKKGCFFRVLVFVRFISHK